MYRTIAVLRARGPTRYGVYQPKEYEKGPSSFGERPSHEHKKSPQEAMPWTTPMVKMSHPKEGRLPQQKPLLRPWFYNEFAEKMPVDGKFDYNSGAADYWFGKPYFVYQKAEQYYYEQIGFIDNDLYGVKCICLGEADDLADIHGDRKHQYGKITHFPREAAIHLLNTAKVTLYNETKANLYRSRMIERQKLEKEEQRIREKEKKFETMVRLDVDDETDEGIRPQETDDFLGRGHTEDFSWLHMMVLRCEYPAGIDWVATPETLHRGILFTTGWFLDPSLISIREDDELGIGQLDPVGNIPITIDLTSFGLGKVNREVEVKQQDENFIPFPNALNDFHAGDEKVKIEKERQKAIEQLLKQGKHLVDH